MKTKQVLILTGVVIGGAVVLHFIINKKNALPTTGPSGAAPTAPFGASTGMSAGNQVYTSQPYATIRSSPQINNAFLGLFGGNLVDTVTNAGSWVGVYNGTRSPDQNGDINPVTGNPYNWYNLTLGGMYVQSGNAGMICYIREDFVTLK